MMLNRRLLAYYLGCLMKECGISNGENEMTMTDEQAARAREITDLSFLIAFTIPHPIWEFVLSNLVDRGWLTDHGERSNPCELSEQGKALVDAALAHAIAALSGRGEAGNVEEVGRIRQAANGDRYIDWALEGGIHALEVGDRLIISDSAITDDTGGGKVFTHPAPAAMDGVATDAMVVAYCEAYEACEDANSGCPFKAGLQAALAAMAKGA